MTEQNKLWEGRFIWAYSFKGLAHGGGESMEIIAVHIMASRTQHACVSQMLPLEPFSSPRPDMIGWSILDILQIDHTFSSFPFLGKSVLSDLR